MPVARHIRRSHRLRAAMLTVVALAIGFGSLAGGGPAAAVMHKRGPSASASARAWATRGPAELAAIHQFRPRAHHFPPMRIVSDPNLPIPKFTVGRAHGTPVPRWSHAGPLGAASAIPPATNNYVHEAIPGATNMARNSGIVMPGDIVVNLVFWLPPGTSFGPTAPDPASDTAYENQQRSFIADVGGTPYFNLLSQYGVRNSVSLGGSVVDTRPYPAGTSTSNPLPASAEATEVAVINSQQNWTTDLSHLTILFTSYGINDSNLTNCGAHNHLAFADGTDSPFAWVADTPNRCAYRNPSSGPHALWADIATSIMAHEFAEAATDPLADSWRNAKGSEVGDLCASDYPTGPWNSSGADVVLNGDPYLVQQLWSNAVTNCDMGQTGSTSPPPAVTVTQSVSNADPAPGSTVTFSLAVANTDPYGSATNLTLSETLPSNFTVTAIDDPGGLTSNYTGSSFTVIYSALPVIQSVNVTITATVTAGQASLSCPALTLDNLAGASLPTVNGQCVSLDATVTPDQHMNSLFTYYGDTATCAGWGGGDGASSVDLQDGNRAWFFSDTFLNNPAERKKLWFASGIHNSIVMQSGNTLRTITGGNTCQEHNFNIPFSQRYALTPAVPSDSSTGGFFWTQQPVLDGDNVVEFYIHGHSTGILTPYMAAIPKSTLETSSSVTISPQPIGCANNVNWGMTVFHWTVDNYTYIYGWSNPLPRRLYVARTTPGNISNFSTWQFYAGGSGQNPSWSSNCTDSVPLPISSVWGGTVTEANGSLWYIDNIYGSNQIIAYPAPNPWSFSDTGLVLYNIPEPFNTYPYYYFTYSVNSHPGLSNVPNTLVISYSVNTWAVDTGCVSANYHDASIYRPRYLDVPLAVLNPTAAITARAATTTSTTAVIRHGHGGLFAGIHNGPVPPSGVSLGKGFVPLAPLTMHRAFAATTADSIDGATDWFTSCPSDAPASGLSTQSHPDGTTDLNWAFDGTDVWYYLKACDHTVNSCTPGAPVGTDGWIDGYNGLWSITNSSTVEPEIGYPNTINGDTWDFQVTSFPAGYYGSGGGPSNIAETRAWMDLPTVPTSVIGQGGTVSWSPVTYPGPGATIGYGVSYWDVTKGQTIYQAGSSGMLVGVTTYTLPHTGDTYGACVKAMDWGGISTCSATVYLTP